MEPVTHILTGACLARSGLNRRAAYATVAMATAAEFPDIDTLWSLRGPVTGFERHRGITHTFLGIPFEAAFLLLLFWLVHRWRSQHAGYSSPARESQRSEAGQAPLRWGLLYSFILLALLSHILLDYTNNYGVRPFFPFDPHWYAASIVFIFDPLLFIFLVAGLLLPALFALIGQEVGAKRQRFRGAGWARLALACVVALWLARAYEHATAVELANQQILQAPAVETSADQIPPGETDEDSSSQIAPQTSRPTLVPLRSLASPDPLSIFRWYTATDFGPAYRLGTADTQLKALAAGKILNKPAMTPYLRSAEASHLGRVYLDWSAMPWISTDANSPQSTDATGVTVSFEDLRFMGSTPLLNRRSAVPLTGVVVVNPMGQVLAQGMNGHFER